MVRIVGEGKAPEEIFKFIENEINSRSSVIK